MFYCGHCGRELRIEANIKREEVCPSCGGYLHCCLNCRFFAGRISRGCSEPQTEEVRDRETANFCDFFVFAEGRSPATSANAASRAKVQFESLFRKRPPEETPSS
jgi:hypothetical protein